MRKRRKKRRRRRERQNVSNVYVSKSKGQED